MTISAKQLKANKDNAQKSTGPRSEQGKELASINGMKHGLFSQKLCLEDESYDEFDRLINDLHLTLKPVGTLENSLVERIALAMWRQKRLAVAEAAAVGLARRKQKIASKTSSELDMGFSSLSEDELSPYDEEQRAWCQAVVEEVGRLDEFDLEKVKETAPLVYKQLTSDAEEDQESIESFVESSGELTSYVYELKRWCNKELKKAEGRPDVISVAKLVRDKELLLPRHQLDLIARYQTTLDNQLYKALKALREAQDWRAQTLDIIPERSAIAA